MNNHRKPEIAALGQITFIINFDTGEFSINLSNPHTKQLTTPEEAANLLPMTGINLFIQEIRKRSRETIVT